MPPPLPHICRGRSRPMFSEGSQHPTLASASPSPGPDSAFQAAPLWSKEIEGTGQPLTLSSLGATRGALALLDLDILQDAGHISMSGVSLGAKRGFPHIGLGVPCTEGPLSGQAGALVQLGRQPEGREAGFLALQVQPGALFLRGSERAAPGLVSLKRPKVSSVLRTSQWLTSAWGFAPHPPFCVWLCVCRIWSHSCTNHNLPGCPSIRGGGAGIPGQDCFCPTRPLPH